MLIISRMTQAGACIAVIAFDSVPATPLIVSSQPNSPAMDTMRKNMAVRNIVRAAHLE